MQVDFGPDAIFLTALNKLWCEAAEELAKVAANSCSLRAGCWKKSVKQFGEPQTSRCYFHTWLNAEVHNKECDQWFPPNRPCSFMCSCVLGGSQHDKRIPVLLACWSSLRAAIKYKDKREPQMHFVFCHRLLKRLLEKSGCQKFGHEFFPGTEGWLKTKKYVNSIVNLNSA